MPLKEYKERIATFESALNDCCNLSQRCLAAAFRDAHGPLAQLAFDVVDKFSPAQRPSDRRAYTHKLNFELDTGVAAFNWLPAGRWLRGVELEGSLDYVASGLPRCGDIIEGTRFLDNTNPWSFSLVFVVAPM